MHAINKDWGERTMKNNEHKFTETTLQTERVFSGKVIQLDIEQVELPNGAKSSREIVRHPGAVAVLIVDDGKMIVVDQYRKPLGRNQVEIPAGKLDPGEDPRSAAARELQEETGYLAESLKLIYSFYTAPGFTDEIVHLYAAEGLSKGEAKPDEDEFLEMMAVTMDEAKQLIRENRISDAKTLMAVYAWERYERTGEYEL